MLPTYIKLQRVKNMYINHAYYMYMHDYIESLPLIVTIDNLLM